MLPIISTILDSTIGKIVDKAISFLPMSESEKDKVKLEVLNAIVEEQKELNSTINMINSTMQAELKSDHFIVYSWRPIIGYIFALTIFVNYAVGAFISIPKLAFPNKFGKIIQTFLGFSAAGRTIKKI